MSGKIDVNLSPCYFESGLRIPGEISDPEFTGYDYFATSKQEIALTPQSQKNLIFSEVIERLS